MERAFRGALLVAAFGALFLCRPARAETLTLKNGLVLSGSLGKISSVGADPLAPAGAGQVKLKRIIIVDDQLRRIFVGSNQVAAEPGVAPFSPTERILLSQRVAMAGRNVASVGPIIRVTPFDEFGRRTFTMSTGQGPIDIVQGITEITPIWTEVKALQGAGNYVWTSKIATSSIPRETLSKILYRRIDPKNSDDRLRIVRLYQQAERIQDARAELEQLIADFPSLAALQAQVDALNQLASRRLLKEVELRRDAGQPALAITMLEKFPADGVAGETLLQVREMLGQFVDLKEQGDKVHQLLGEHVAALKDDRVREELTPVVEEISSELTVHNIDRMADYLRLADDPATEAEEKISLAVSGWMMGSGAGIDNIRTAQSLAKVRALVQKYLVSRQKHERDAILAELASLEAATPTYVTKIIANMKPPLSVAPPAAEPENVEAILGPKEETPKEPAKVPLAPLKRPAPAPKDDPKTPVQPAGIETSSCEEKGGGLLDDPTLPRLEKGPRRDNAVVPAAAEEEIKTQPPETGAAAPASIPGLMELSVPGLAEDPEFKYHVQLPPEYSPYRRYPCVVTLNGSGTTPVQQVDWWAGPYSADAGMRYGQATRHGYIVIAPRWQRPHQRKHEFSVREHAAILYTLRDACKRFSIDTDRVFLSGHSMGGDAAWDIGLAHPDLWAGVIPIVATADKYVTRYWENGKNLPMYFVCGEKDGNKLGLNATDWDRYLTHSGYDVMIVQYQGRGHEHFHDEIQQIFDWMNLHRRNFFPKEVEFVTMRPWDSFFWWIEVSKLPEASQVLPAEWPKQANVKKSTGEINAANGISVSAAGEKTTVWVSPDMVDFNNKVTVRIDGRAYRNVVPDIAVLLEDVRTRGDRKHPFWAKVQN